MRIGAGALEHNGQRTFASTRRACDKGAMPSRPAPGSARADAEAYDCRTCGACCAPEIILPFYVTLRANDLARLTPEFRERNVARASLLTKRDPIGRCVCVALRGTIGRRCSCSIYERRPDECRKLEEGTAECRRARKQAGLPV
jgi:hypothetical protein